MKKIHINWGGKKEYKTINKHTWIFIAEIFVFIFICFLHALEAGHYANFSPINGTFQNYNPVRRFLDGQVPYKDYQDYLGMGHLYAGTVMTMLLGGSYKSSLIAFSFLTFLGAGLIFLCLGLSIFRKKEIAVAVSNIILMMLLIQPLFFMNIISGTDEIRYALLSALSPGNSARFVRGMILPLSVIFFFIGYKFYLTLCKKYKVFKEKKKLCAVAGIGVLAGFSFIWSNDYGISVWLCLMVSSFFVFISRNRSVKKALIEVVIELAISIIAISLFVELFTLGHFGNWFRTIFGTGNYQSWYYNSGKSYYIYDVDFSYIMMIQAILSIVYLYKLYKGKGEKKAIVRYGIPSFANMTAFCAVNEYHLLSGDGSTEVALAVLFATIVFELLYFIGGFIAGEKTDKIVMIVANVTALAWCVAIVKEEVIFSTMTEKEGIYVDALGGNMTALGEDLVQTQQFLNDENFFATYASAQEVVADIYQPSGIDYIIHVLGDKQRADYLNIFHIADFKYAATIKETYTPWEYWVQRANWFFYRELYKDWHPVYSNSYETYWEKNQVPDENSKLGNYMVNVIELDDSTKKFIINTDSGINGIADVYVDYQVKKKDIMTSSLVFCTNIKVQNTGILSADAYFESNYLRPTGAEYIPVPIVNGYGEVTITSNPKKETYLEIHNVECQKIYDVMYSYIEASAIEDKNGLSFITVPKTAKAEKILSNAESISVAGQDCSIVGTETDDSSIYIKVDTNGAALNPDEMLLYDGNIFKVE